MPVASFPPRKRRAEQEAAALHVHLGNTSAIEGYRDPDSDDPDLVRYRELGGNRVTEITFPPDWTLLECFDAAVKACKAHFAEGTGPVWVESDSDGLASLLKEHFGLKGKAGRPDDWRVTE